MFLLISWRALSLTLPLSSRFSPFASSDESTPFDDHFLLSLGLSPFLSSNLIDNHVEIEMQMKDGCFGNLFANDALVGSRSIYADNFDTCLLGFGKFLKEGLQAMLFPLFSTQSPASIATRSDDIKTPTSNSRRRFPVTAAATASAQIVPRRR